MECGERRKMMSWWSKDSNIDKVLSIFLGLGRLVSKSFILKATTLVTCSYVIHHYLSKTDVTSVATGRSNDHYHSFPANLQ